MTDTLADILFSLPEIGSNCYCLNICPDIWLIIFKFLCVKDIANLRLISQKFRWLNCLNKTVNKFSKFSEKIFKIEILTELKSFLKEFIEKLKLIKKTQLKKAM